MWETQNTAATLNNYDIYGRRLAQGGGVLDSDFIVRGGGFSDRRWDKRFPTVTANALDFFVSWQDNANFSALGWDVYGKTVTRNGVVGLAEVIANTANSETSPDIAWNGGFYLVAYTFDFSSTDHDIYAQKVSPFQGSVLGDGTLNGKAFDARIPISTPATDQVGPEVASEGFQDMPCSTCADPTARGKPLLVVWTDSRLGTSGDAFGNFISAAGAVVNAGTPIQIGTGPRSQGAGGVAFNGVYLVVWLDIDGWRSRIPVASTAPE